ncbi:unnamed protein product, partial [Didymodactylos carnosus]
KTIVNEMRLKVKKCLQSDLSVLLGRYLVELGEYRAIKKYLKSLLETSILNNDPSIASVYNCLEMIHSRPGLYGDALNYYKQALSHQARLDYSNTNALGEIHNDIGDAYIKLSYLDEAFQRFSEAERTLLREPYMTRKHFAIIQCNIGYVLKEITIKKRYFLNRFMIYLKHQENDYLMQ